MKIKENEKRDKFLDLTEELKAQWNMKVTVTLIVSGVLGTIPKGLAKGLKELETGGQVETIKHC